MTDPKSQFSGRQSDYPMPQPRTHNIMTAPCLIYSIIHMDSSSLARNASSAALPPIAEPLLFWCTNKPNPFLRVLPDTEILLYKVSRKKASLACRPVPNFQHLRTSLSPRHPSIDHVVCLPPPPPTSC